MKKEYKDVVRVKTIIIDDNGKHKSESWKHPFNTGTLPEMTKKNGYSLDKFFYSDDLDYQIVGDEDVQDESLEVEELEFKEMGYVIEII